MAKTADREAKNAKKETNDLAELHRMMNECIREWQRSLLVRGRARGADPLYTCGGPRRATPRDVMGRQHIFIEPRPAPQTHRDQHPVEDGRLVPQRGVAARIRSQWMRLGECAGPGLGHGGRHTTAFKIAIFQAGFVFGPARPVYTVPGEF